MPNTLFYGDNLQVLRDYVPDESVDLVYLDPPFNSNASYNVLFREKSGEESPAQIKAFTDTWEWTLETERTFQQDIILHTGTPPAVKDMITAFRQFIGQNAMMAYLVMMTPRLGGTAPCPQAHRKPLPPLRPHRQPLFEAVVGYSLWGQAFLKRNHLEKDHCSGDPQRYGRISDRIFFYSKSQEKVFNRVSGNYSDRSIGPLQI